MGLRVPEGYVIVGATPGQLPEDLEEACAKLGDTALAVRSSALGEDGAETSFAGQYETVLDVRGTQAVREAVERCLRSAHGDRADAYCDGLSASGEARMSVVVQRMVDARAAGVLFTVDPVNGVRDRVVVNAVAGLGEALVSGQRTADQFVLSRDGKVLESQVQGPTPAIDAAMLQTLLSDALAAEAKLGYPVDMEWAIASDGSLYWLQARPITTLDAPDLNELDSTLPHPNCVLTTYNISEVMPGAATPLTSSVLGRRLDSIMNELYVRCGVPPALFEGRPLVLDFYGHQFINMNTMYLPSTQVLGMSKEELDHTLAGRVLPDVELDPNAPFHQRLLNTVRYVRLLFQARERLDAFTHRTADFRWSPGQDMATVYRWIDEAVEVVREPSRSTSTPRRSPARCSPSSSGCSVVGSGPRRNTTRMRRRCWPTRAPGPRTLTSRRVPWGWRRRWTRWWRRSGRTPRRRRGSSPWDRTRRWPGCASKHPSPFAPRSPTTCATMGTAASARWSCTRGTGGRTRGRWCSTSSARRACRARPRRRARRTERRRCSRGCPSGLARSSGGCCPGRGRPWCSASAPNR
ncbi:PEP/pyruvate-binding domain-containing protein [Cystobacter fuscus]